MWLQQQPSQHAMQLMAGVSRAGLMSSGRKILGKVEAKYSWQRINVVIFLDHTRVL